MEPLPTAVRAAFVVSRNPSTRADSAERTSFRKEHHERDEKHDSNDGQEPKNSSPSEELGLVYVSRVKAARRGPDVRVHLPPQVQLLGPKAIQL